MYGITSTTSSANVISYPSGTTGNTQYTFHTTSDAHPQPNQVQLLDSRLSALDAQFAQIVLRLGALEAQNRDLVRELEELRSDPVGAVKTRVDNFQLRH